MVGKPGPTSKICVMSEFNLFKLDGKIAVITGGGGFLGAMHAEAVAEAGGIPILADINETAAIKTARGSPFHDALGDPGLPRPSLCQVPRIHGSSNVQVADPIGF